MAALRACFLSAVLLFTVTFLSRDIAVMAEQRPRPAVDVCHDGVWGLAEYCGRDAYMATGVPEMNHDCFVDGLDVGLFIDQWQSTGSGLSADINGDGIVDELDVLLFAPSYGDHPTDCVGEALSSCAGTIALSFSPVAIDSNEAQVPGTHTVFVMIDGFADAKFVEYAIQWSPNVVITNNTLLVPGEHGLPACNTGAFNDVIAFSTPVSSGPLAIAEIEYELLDANPATLTIKPGNCPWSRVRWAAADTKISRDFTSVLSVGINGPTPAPGLCPGTTIPFGTVTGKIYVDVNGDCLFTPGIDAPGEHFVVANPGPYHAYPDAAGDYTLTAPPGSSTISLYATAYDAAEIMACQNATFSVNIPANGNVPGIDFALKPTGTISGRIYRNIETPDCSYNGVDFPLPWRLVEAVPGGFLAIADATGNYEMAVPLGSYTVSHFPIASDPLVPEACQPASIPVNVVYQGVSAGNDFALHLGGPPFCGASLQIVPNGFNVGAAPCNTRVLRNPCPGIEYEYILVVKADLASTFAPPIGSTLEVTLDSEFIINSVSCDRAITVIASNGANERTVQFDDSLWPGLPVAVHVRATPLSGGPYTSEATFDEGGLCGGIVTATSTIISNCSCDPNDLSVTPEGCGPNYEIMGDAPLTYTIRFENVGPGPAHDIRIEDQLDADLDLSSISVIASSHPVTGLQINPDDLLVIRLDGIELPGTYGPGSNKGYVIVTADPLPGLPDGTTISSTAAITFDFNDPVITNTVTNTIMAEPCPVTGVGGDEVPRSTFLGANHPNPFNPVTTIDYGLASPQRVSISIFNVTGELVRTLLDERKPAGRFSVDWDGRDDSGNLVASGVYMSRMSAGSFSQVRKLVLLK